MSKKGMSGEEFEKQMIAAIDEHDRALDKAYGREKLEREALSKPVEGFAVDVRAIGLTRDDEPATGARTANGAPKKPKKKGPTAETLLRKAVMKYLASDGWFVYRNLQGLGCYPGIADLTAIKSGRVVWIELKAPKGKQSYVQWEFEQALYKQGGDYCLVRSIEELEEALTH